MSVGKRRNRLLQGREKGNAMLALSRKKKARVQGRRRGAIFGSIRKKKSIPREEREYPKARSCSWGKKRRSLNFAADKNREGGNSHSSEGRDGNGAMGRAERNVERGEK